MSLLGRDLASALGFLVSAHASVLLSLSHGSLHCWLPKRPAPHMGERAHHPVGTPYSLPNQLFAGCGEETMQTVPAPGWGLCVPMPGYSTRGDPAPQPGFLAAWSRATRRICAFLWPVPPHRSARHLHKLHESMNRARHHGIDSAGSAASPD